MSKSDELKQAALNAVPATGEIEAATLIQDLKSSGNGEAVALLSVLKREGKVKASLVMQDDGTLRHTYSRVEGA